MFYWIKLKVQFLNKVGRLCSYDLEHWCWWNPKRLFGISLVFCFSHRSVSLGDLPHDWSLLVTLNKADWWRRKLFSTDYNCLWWVIENQKLRFRSGFSLLRVVKCLLMPRSGEPSPVPEMNTHPLIFFDLKHLSVVRLRHTWLLNPRLFQLHLTWLPPFDYSVLTWSWGHQRKEGEITCSCSNLGFHLMGLRLPLFSPAKLIRSLVLILLYSVALSVLSPTASVSVKFKCRTWEQRCPSVV